MPSLFVHLPRPPPSRRPRWPPRLTQSATFPTRPVFLARKHLPPPRLQPRLRPRLVAPRLAPLLVRPHLDDPPPAPKWKCNLSHMK